MFWSFVATAILIELTPGPNMTWLAVRAATHGRVFALAAVAGIALGLSIAALVAGLGLTALFNQIPALFEALRWAGAAYLLYLAWDTWRDADAVNLIENKSIAQSFGQGLITNILNPKAYLFYAAMLPRFVDDTTSVASQIAALSAVYVIIATLIHAAVALFAGSASNWLQKSSLAQFIRKGLALIIAATAVWFFYSTQVTQ
jgi:threonine/homoserine/homoserine lactone efflux protein